jgi:excisionase family DNA binding protein
LATEYVYLPNARTAPIRPAGLPADWTEPTPADAPHNGANGHASRGRGRPPGSRNKVSHRTKPPPPPDPTVMAVRVPEAARRLSLGVSSVKELVTTGRLPSVKVGAVRLIPVKAIAEFLERGAK